MRWRAICERRLPLACYYLLDVGPGAASVQKRLLRQRVNCCVARAQAGVLLRRLKFALPVERQDEAERLTAVLDKQNAGQGPGYTLLGIVVRASKVWALAGGMLSLVAGAGISVIRDAESGTAATGSFDA